MPTQMMPLNIVKVQNKVINEIRFLLVNYLVVPALGLLVCLLETFVDTTRFQGTCYRAANWIRVGETTGRGKYDRFNQRREPIKAVFLYPLIRNFREALHG